MKKKLLTVVMAATLALLACVSSTASAGQPSQTFSIVVHIEYPNGFVYEHAFISGVAPADVNTYLAECGKSHRDSNWLRLRCFAIPE